MAFAMIRPESRPFLDPADALQASVQDADTAVAVLRSDYERWSRWGVGVLGFVLAVAGAFVAVGLGETLRMLGGTPHALDLAMLAAAAAIGITGCAMLAVLWRSGRRLVAVTSAWQRAPYVDGRRQRSAAGWLRARAVNLEPRILARLVTATLALLLGVAGIALALRDLAGQFTSLTVASAVVGVIALAAGAGQAGGVVRLVSGIAAGDPLWAGGRGEGN